MGHRESKRGGASSKLYQGVVTISSHGEGD